MRVACSWEEEPHGELPNRLRVDTVDVAVIPVLLGKGEHLLHDIDLRALGYECWKSVPGERATHVFVHKRS